MQIIIVGCGKVGRGLVSQLSREDNNITVIDTNARLVRDVSTIYDVMGVVGNGTSYSVLQEADLAHTDMLVAVTESDEVNLLTCVIAKRKKNCHTIARVRNPIYSEERHFLRNELQLSMTINPEYEAAWEMSRLLRFPNAIEVESFAKDRIDLLRFRVPKQSMLIGAPLKEAAQKVSQNILICIVERGQEIVIPNGDFVIEEGDILTVVAMPGEAETFFRTIGLKIDRARSCVIVGGGGISYYLTKILLRQGVAVKVIEKKRDRCEFLSREFPKANVVCGDGTDKDLLSEERLDSMDAMAACTGIDEVNAILSLYAEGRVKKKVITKLNHINFNEVIDSLDLDSVVNPKQLTASRILQYVRAARNSMGSNVETLYRLMKGRVEALEFRIDKSCRMIGVMLQDLKLKDDILLAGIMRDGKLIIPGGHDAVQQGDSVIVITTHLGFEDIHDILQ